MATTNPFNLLGIDDNHDPVQLIEKLPPPVKKSTAEPPPAKLPNKPLPPSQAVREARTDGQRGGGRTGGRGIGGRGRGGRFSRDSADISDSLGNSNNFSGGYRKPEGDIEKSYERRGYGGPGGASRGGGGRRGGYGNRDFANGERPQRVFERHSWTGWGNEDVKDDGSGRGNWGTPNDDVAPATEVAVVDGEKNVDAEKQELENAEGTTKETSETEPQEKESESMMTLEEYEKVLEEKRKTLVARKSEERKVDLDKAFESMQLISSKKNDEEIFVKLGSDKDKRKEAIEKDEKARKAVSINEFLKPAEGEIYHSPGGRRGLGRGPRGYTGFGGSNMVNNIPAPKIEDVKHFPSLGGK